MQDSNAYVEGGIGPVINRGHLEAGTDDADEGEDDEEQPARRTTKAMTNGENDGENEYGQVDYDGADGDTVSVGYCSCHDGEMIGMW